VTESELLLKINKGIPAETLKRYNELIARREAEALTPEEYSELLRLTEQVEKLETQRVECLAELARIRKTTLTVLMRSLGLRTPTYG
jgi:DNA-binding helix-hairpin-helix protein with protein kinase domain